VDSIKTGESSLPSRAQTRRRFSRSFSRARWPEYGRLLKAALSADYSVVSLESFLDQEVSADEASPILILRHDVDQHPSSALTMSDIEVSLGVRSSWYFRWRTAHPAVIAELRRRGSEVGFHYETLTREALAAGSGRLSESPNRLARGRDCLREEIEIFEGLFGPIRSIAAHGDTRVPEVRNAELLRDQEWSDYGIAYDANDAMRRHQLAAWLTDRSMAEGGWSDGLDPFSLIHDRQTPILCLTHPNNWVSGASLWRDRLLARVFPRPRVGSPSRIVRTGADTPPSA
jgi:hypothetical protein